MEQVKISASLLSADFARLGESAARVLAAGADMLHVDVMDHHYVPNLTMGPMFCQALRNYGITAPLDVHLMVQPVDPLIEAFAKAGATRICFHPEASNHVDRSLQLIKDHQVEAGLVLNPATPLSHLEYVAQKLDFVLLMTVNPGFGGQAFIDALYPKITATRHMLDQASTGKFISIAVDGGVNVNNCRKIITAGADTLIVGNALFKADDYAQTLNQLRGKA